jgi:hypothetical protein
MIYKLYKNPRTDQLIGVKKIEETCEHNISFDPDNTDYQQYLAWLSEGNTPEPADEQT